MNELLGHDDEPLESSQAKSLNLKWIKETVGLKKYLKAITDEDFSNVDRAEVLKISLVNSLIQLAESEHARGHEFPQLLKMEQVRHAISILKRLHADLNMLQSDMESAYGLCRGTGI